MLSEIAAITRLVTFRGLRRWIEITIRQRYYFNFTASSPNVRINNTEKGLHVAANQDCQEIRKISLPLIRSVLLKVSYANAGYTDDTLTEGDVSFKKEKKSVWWFGAACCFMGHQGPLNEAGVFFPVSGIERWAATQNTNSLTPPALASCVSPHINPCLRLVLSLSGQLENTLGKEREVTVLRSCKAASLGHCPHCGMGDGEVFSSVHAPLLTEGCCCCFVEKK